MKGFVYIMTNPAFKLDLLKIGWTRNIEKRLKQASGTNVPEDYILQAEYSVKDMDKAEKLIFEILKEYRYSINKEFFLIELEYAKFVCETVVNAVNANKPIKLNPVSDKLLDSLTSRLW